MTLSADEAFAAYEAVRHRLPPARSRTDAPARAETLAEIADDFDAVLLDAFGVLNIGERAIPGTRERIENLRAAGKQVLVVSNAASVPKPELERKYRRLGYDFAAGDIVTSRDALAARADGLGDLHWGAMTLSNAVLDDLAAPAITPLGDDPATYEAAEGFLLIGSGEWTPKRQGHLARTLKARPRRVLVANPDIVAPRENGFSAEPGHFAHQLADATGIEPEFYGKPFGNIFDLAFERLGAVEPSRVLMVGDSLHTDILGAQAAGVASALVTDFGFLAGTDATGAIEASGIVPDFVVSRP